MKPSDPDTAKLLRWYPRAWRERYGEEFLAMIEDSLDGRPPTWRLRVSVAWAGLRERGHRVRLAGQKALLRGLTSRWGVFLVAGFLLATLPNEFKAPPPPRRAWQATAALDLLTAIAVLTAVALLAGGLAAVPAVVRYVRAGGWPIIRRRVAWAAGATAAAAGAFAGLVLASRSQSFSRLNGSWTYFTGVLATNLALVVALWLWTSVVTAMAKRLDLGPRVRKAEKMLGAVAAFAVSAMLSVNVVWYSVIQSSVFLLLLGITGLAAQMLGAAQKIRLAARSGRHSGQKDQHAARPVR